jgi:disulfide bond formation protein DsbB
MPPTLLRRALWLVSAACLAAVVAALVSQHAFDMQPCPWCILQRLMFVTIALLAFVFALLPAFAGRAGSALLALLALAGAAAAIYQNRIAAKSASCDLSLAERLLTPLKLDTWLPSVFEIRASCADAANTLLGLPYEVWSALLFLAVAALCGWLAIRRPHRFRRLR